MKKVYRVIKRFLDLIVSFLAIIILSPILLILSLIVKCTTKGPVLFKDTRVGRYGKDIVVYKFRTMHVDAETNIEKYLTKEELEIWTKERKLDRDPRITKVGKFLRKTSLDELPQLFNILFGTLSIVGNRPITRREYDMWFTDEEKAKISSIKPGLTGYWQVSGRSNVTFESGERQKLDLYYIDHYSMWLDIKIIFKTPFVVLFKTGAK